MPLKQDTAAEDSAATIDEISKLFLAMGLPYLAEGKLYLGAPYSILESFQRALDMQHAEIEKNKFKNRLKYAGIARERTAEIFKWDNGTYPFVEPGMIENALAIDFIRQRKNLVVVGPPGVGKSLLVIIIACKAIREYCSVKYKTAHRIATDLQEARDGNSLAGYIKKLQSCDVFVVEDITFTNFDLKTAHSFFSIIDGRYGRKTTIITANGSIKEWASDFPDKRMASALLGRLYEDALLINMNGAEDMRLKRAMMMLENSSKNEAGLIDVNQ
jgi:DNA replication protein DnaC